MEVLIVFFPCTSRAPLKKLLFSEQMKSRLQRRRAQGSAQAVRQVLGPAAASPSSPSRLSTASVSVSVQVPVALPAKPPPRLPRSGLVPTRRRALEGDCN